jgi:holo-[acyl-carrier protein] synthase
VIVGVGIDAIEIARVRAACTRTPSLVARLYTAQERASCTSRCGDLRFGGLAARFAAKEAVAKALGRGVRGFRWLDIEVLNDEHGRPVVRLHGGAARLAEELGVAAVHLSLTTSTDLAVAQAVAEGRR